MVLSPIEGVNATEQKAGITYLDKMYQDLAALKGFNQVGIRQS
jgi:hypothetical protein